MELESKLVDEKRELSGSRHSSSQEDDEVGSIPILCDHDVNGKLMVDGNDPGVDVEVGARQPLIYRINEVPPVHMVILFAFQQTLLVISSPLTLTILISEVVCMQKDEHLKLLVLNAIFLVTGLSTFLMTTFGVRLPIFQGPAKSYMIPLLAMSTLEEWKCPATFKEIDPLTNATILMTVGKNSSTIPARDFALGKISLLSGGLVAAGFVHCLIGMTGLVGVLCRYIGPVTIVPTIVLIGLNIFKVIVKLSEPCLSVSMVVVFFNILFSLVLGRKQTPIPWWSRDRGFHIFWYPLHQVFSILISLLIGWALSAILTASAAFTDNPESKEFLARTDARNFIIDQTSWFSIPYPGKLGPLSFNVGVFIHFLIASVLSVLDSIGDYAACAKMARVTPPPGFAFNRGIAVEGAVSLLSGTMGCCAATVSYGANIGAMGITRVVSRRVFQTVGLFFILFSIFSKFGAFFITIPYPVLGGTMLVSMGIFVGVVLSYLESVDLSSTRNVAIVGMALLLGLVLPNWVARNHEDINTGNDSLNVIIQMLLSNPSFVGGIFSCVLDNLVPGTLRERGLLNQLKDLDDQEEKEMAKSYDDGPEVYRLPFLPKKLRQSRFAKLIPLFEYEEGSVVITSK